MKRFINNTKLAAGSFPTTLKKALLPAIALGILLLAGGATSAHAAKYHHVDSTTEPSLERFDRAVESELTEDICTRISPKKKVVKNARKSVVADLNAQCSPMPRGCATACSQIPAHGATDMWVNYKVLSGSTDVFVGGVRKYPKQCGKRPARYSRHEVDAYSEGLCGCSCTFEFPDRDDWSNFDSDSELTPEVRGGIFVGNPADTFTGAPLDEQGVVNGADLGLLGSVVSELVPELPTRGSGWPEWHEPARDDVVM